VIEPFVNTDGSGTFNSLQQWQQGKRTFRASQSKSNKVNGES